jgi:ParB-like chromosome segregation protein Spo0J
MADEHDLKITTVALDDLVPDPANARRHDQRNLDAIRGSLARWGQVEPVLVQRGTRRIVAGHGRIEAMRSLGRTHAAIVEIDLDGVEATALSIALNRTAELASWEDDVLASLLDSLPDELTEVAGFTDEEVEALLGGLTDPAEFAPASEDDQSRLDEKAPTVCPKCGHEWVE